MPRVFMFQAESLTMMLAVVNAIHGVYSAVDAFLSGVILFWQHFQKADHFFGLPCFFCFMRSATHRVLTGDTIQITEHTKSDQSSGWILKVG